MSYNLNKDQILIGEKRRIFFKRKNIANLFYPMAIFLCFFTIFSIVAPALAIETTKASALTTEEMRETYSLSNSQKSPQHNKALDTCHSFLNTYFSQDAINDKVSPSNFRRSIGENNTAPLALSVFLGVRIALGPKETINQLGRVQTVSTLQANTGGYPRALAIAAYRACKNEQNLKQHKNNNKT